MQKGPVALLDKIDGNDGIQERGCHGWVKQSSTGKFECERTVIVANSMLVVQSQNASLRAGGLILCLFHQNSFARL